MRECRLFKGVADSARYGLWLGLALASLAGLGCRAEPETASTESPPEEPADTSVAQQTRTDPLIRPTEPVDPRSCLSGGCHQERIQAKFQHNPVVESRCDTCHSAEQPGHTFPVKTTGAALCTSCHDIVGLEAHTHAVIEHEGCLPCHEPHGTNVRSMLTEMSVELVCRQCHRTERKAHLHAPFAVGECAACHDPHEASNARLLNGGEGKDHCFTCHTYTEHQIASSTFVHKPVMDTGCSDCHVRHTSEYRYILTKPIYDLCVECHPNIREERTDKETAHGAVFTGHHCSNCHDPHAADRTFRLRADERSLCLNCHNRPQEARDGRVIPGMQRELLTSLFQHGPIRAGNCSACHYIHTTSHTNHLRNYFPKDFYDAFNLANYALCFKCHSNRIVLDGRNIWFTGFRDGTRNLHYVHVNRPKKGRTCRTCHELHGSNLPKHMASEVPFEGGGWAMPVRIKQTETGGRCSPGCHEPREYIRSPSPVHEFPESGLDEAQERGESN
ncbi:MAG: hypothetical protein JSU63_04200 [Phycisphaerales bacterium]|nr:MAG: hypothetical protein JSU63_04200 [Phycisphaerales bacterium]